MTCIPFKVATEDGTVVTGIACVRRARRRCRTCKKAVATYECDVCDAPLCNVHRQTDARGDVCPACYARPALPFANPPVTDACSSTAPDTDDPGGRREPEPDR